jgi:hypothetical protein
MRKKVVTAKKLLCARSVGDVWQLTGVGSARSFWPSKWMMQNNVYRADSSLHKIGDGRIFSILLVCWYIIKGSAY